MKVRKKGTNKEDPKVVFRRSKAWKTFREKLRKKQKKDYVTGSPLSKTCNCHHGDLRPENYSDISDESKFICLNQATHECLHRIYGDGKNRYDWRERIKKLTELCEWMDEINKN